MTSPRLQWFMRRVGKVIYKNCSPFGNPNSFDIKGQDGVFIINRKHAKMIYELETSGTWDNKIKYFDTREEAEQYQLNQKQ